MSFVGWHLMLIVLVLLAAAAVVAAIVIRRRGAPQAGPENAGLLRFVAVFALVAAGFAAVGAAVGVIATLAGRAVSVDVPIADFLPTLPSDVTEVDGPTATIVGGADHLALTIGDLSITTRVLLSLGLLVGGATFVAIALSVRRLARSAIADDAYRGVASRVLWIAASVLAVGTFVQGVLTQLGAYGAGVEALQISGYAADGPAGQLVSDDRGLEVFGWPQPEFALSIDFTPLMIALAIACVAAILREGERLRVRAEAAEAEIAGLV